MSYNSTDLKTLDVGGPSGPFCRVTARSTILTDGLDVASNTGPWWSLAGCRAIYKTIWGRSITTIVTLYGKVISTIVTIWGVTPAPPVAATGGTIVDYVSGGFSYRSHTFTTTGSFVVTVGGLVDVLVVAGGGGGGGGLSGGGGGGAGGLRYSPSFVVGVGSITVTVGTGGSGNPSCRLLSLGVPHCF